MTTDRLRMGSVNTGRRPLNNSADRVIPIDHDLLGYTDREFYEGGGVLCSVGREGCEVSSPGTAAHTELPRKIIVQRPRALSTLFLLRLSFAPFGQLNLYS